MINRKWVTPLLVVNTLALIDSLYLTWHHYQIEIAKPITKSFCSINSFIDCDSVALSSYARFLGMPAASLGVFAYTFMLGLFVHLFFYRKVEVNKDLQLSFLILVTMFIFSFRQFLASVIFVKAVCIMCIGLYLCIALMLLCNYFILEGKIKWKEGGLRLFDLLRLRNSKETMTYIVVAIMSLIISMSISFLIKSNFEAKITASTSTVDLPEKTMLDYYKELPVQEIDYTNLPFKGAEDAPFVFVEASDFECPYCAIRGAILFRLMEKFEGMIRVYFLHFPLDRSCNKTIKNDFHENSCLAAKYSICVGKVGEFWTYHDYLFENQKQINPIWLPKSLKKFGLSEQDISTCLDSDGKDRLQQDLEQSYKLDIKYTPTIFLNGKKISDLVQREEDIIALLESIMKDKLEK